MGKLAEGERWNKDGLSTEERGTSGFPELGSPRVVYRGRIDEIIHEFNRPELMSSEYPELV